MSTQMTKAVSNNLQVVQTKSYSLVDLENPTTIDTIKNTICKKATDEQLQTFMSLAMHFNLNPFNKEIYFDPSIGVFVGRHGKLRIANRNPQYRGLNSYVIREKDDFVFDAANNKVVKHLSSKGNGKIIGAWAVGKRHGFDDVIEVCYLDEFKKSNPAWNNYAQDMIKYKAEDRVLRTLFNSEYEGIPTIDPEQEMQAELIPSFEDKISPSAGSTDSYNSMLPDSLYDEPEQEEVITSNQIKMFFAKATELDLKANEIKQMLIENDLITKDESGEYSTKTMLMKDFETAYAKLMELAEPETTEQQSLLPEEL